MHVIDCECGAVIQAGHRDDLVAKMREHLEQSHPGDERDDDALKQLVEERAYFATDS
jgi:uncharacterized protein DUF1059